MKNYGSLEALGCLDALFFHVGRCIEGRADALGNFHFQSSSGRVRGCWRKWHFGEQLVQLQAQVIRGSLYRIPHSAVEFLKISIFGNPNQLHRMHYTSPYH